MISAYLEYIYFLVLILVSIMTYLNWRNFKGIFFLFAFFLIYFLEHLILAYLTYGTVRPFFSILYYNFSPLFVLKGPLLLFFVQNIIIGEKKYKWYDIFHFIPFIFKLIDIIPYYLTSYEYKSNLSSLVLSNYENFRTVNLYTFFPQEYELIFRQLQLIFYLIASILIIYKWKSKNELKTDELIDFRMTKKWLFILTSFLLLSTLFPFVAVTLFRIYGENYVDYRNLTETIYFVGLFSYIVLPFVFLLFPNLLYGITLKNLIKSSFVKNVKYLNSDTQFNISVQLKNKIEDVCKARKIKITNSEQFYVLSKRIVEILDTQKPFLNVNFHMENLCEMLNAPKHIVQFCLNSIMEINFSELKKEYRVEHAKILLSQDSILSIEGVGISSGFKSNSNFYNSFKEVTGYTPSNWHSQLKSECI